MYFAITLQKPTGSDIVPVNANVVVSVRAWLFVPEAEYVHKFVNGHLMIHASAAEWHSLATTRSADVRIAAGILYWFP